MTTKTWIEFTGTNKAGGKTTNILHLPTGRWASKGPGAFSTWLIYSETADLTKITGACMNKADSKKLLAA